MTINLVVDVLNRRERISTYEITKVNGYSLKNVLRFK